MIDLIEKYPVVTSITLFSLGIIITIIGFFIRRYWFNKPPKRHVKPNIYASSLMKRKSPYAKISNYGEEPIGDLTVDIEWVDHEETGKRRADRFFNEEEDPVITSSHTCDHLDIGEKKIIGSIPRYTDNGEVTLTIRGKGLISNKNLKESFQIKTSKTERK